MSVSQSIGSALDIPITGKNSVIYAAKRILSRPGLEAHVYLAGANGELVNTFPSGNYILSDGSTGFAAVDGPVGLVLDGMGTSSTVVSIGSTSAGAFASGASITGLGTNVSVTQGRAYQFTYTITACVGQLSTGLGVGSGTAQALNFTGTVSETLFASSTATVFVGLWARGAGITSVTGSVTVTEVTGIHATQATTAKKPTERRGLLNLLTYSQDFTNAAWTKTNVTISGNKLVETVAAGTHNIAETQTTTSGATYTIAVECSAAERNYIGVYAGTPAQGVIFNLTTGAYFGNLVGAPTSYSIAPTGTGTYLCVINYTATGAASAPSVYVCDGTGAFSYTGVATNGINVAKVGHFTGTLTAAQILDSGGIPLTTAAAASNASAGRYSWSFDGGDSLALGSVPFQMADDHAVIAAAKSDTIDGTYYSQGNTADNAPMFTLGISSTQMRAFWRDNVAAQVQLTTPYTNSTAQVVSARKVTNTRVLRVNGAQLATDTTALGTTTFNQAKVGVQGRVADAVYLTGNISIVIAIKGTLSDADMLTLERFAASTLPNAPSF